MKSIRISRRLDELKRVVLPCEFRKKLGMEVGDMLDIYVEDGGIVIKKQVETCSFCDGTDEMIYFYKKPICKTCLKKIKNLDN